MAPRTFHLAVLPGDGIGPEVTAAALEVVRAAAAAHGLLLEVEEGAIGWAAARETGTPLPRETLESCLGADAVFLGAVGHPDARGRPPSERPEAGLLALRRELGCYANLRPLRVMAPLVPASPLRAERIRGADFMIVRELAGGLYYGEPSGRGGGPSAAGGRSGDVPERFAYDTMRYSASEVMRIARRAFRIAAGRRGRVLSVDKANVLEVSRLWREVVTEEAERHPDAELEHMLVDRAAMELVVRPRDFDVILTPNLFGDVLSDEAAGLAGSLGLLPSASLGTGPPLFEPVHGSAPELAGRGIANPVGALLSGAMLLEHGLGAPEAAAAVVRAVEAALAAGVRTADLVTDGSRPVRTRDLTDAVLARLETTEPEPTLPEDR